MTTRAVTTNDRIDKIETDHEDLKGEVLGMKDKMDEMNERMGEMKASLAEISRLLWKKQMDEIRANIALFSKAMGLPPPEFQSTVGTPQPEVTMTANTTLAATEERSKDRATTTLEEKPMKQGETAATISKGLGQSSVGGQLTTATPHKENALTPLPIKVQAVDGATQQGALARQEQPVEKYNFTINIEVINFNDDEELKHGDHNEVTSAFFVNYRRKKSSIIKFKKKEKGIGIIDLDTLAKVKWSRDVWDDSRTITNLKTQVDVDCSNLKAKRKWCLFGSPKHNSVKELFCYHPKEAAPRPHMENGWGLSASAQKWRPKGRFGEWDKLVINTILSGGCKGVSGLGISGCTSTLRTRLSRRGMELIRSKEEEYGGRSQRQLLVYSRRGNTNAK